MEFGDGGHQGQPKAGARGAAAGVQAIEAP